MHNFFRKLVGTGVVCGMLVFAAPLTSMAAIGPGFAAGTYVATVTAESVNINKNRDSEEVLFTVKAGSTYEVLEDCGDGWMKVRVHDTEGYLPVSENAVVEEAEEGEIAMIQKEARESSASYKRQQLADYALQFVGGPYQYGGSDPHTGVDCSGFTRYVYQHGAGITLNRSSRGQALQGKKSVQIRCVREIFCFTEAKATLTMLPCILEKERSSTLLRSAQALRFPTGITEIR